MPTDHAVHDDADNGECFQLLVIGSIGDQGIGVVFCLVQELLVFGIECQDVLFGMLGVLLMRRHCHCYVLAVMVSRVASKGGTRDRRYQFPCESKAHHCTQPLLAQAAWEGEKHGTDQKGYN
jgi:hypothetical protein